MEANEMVTDIHGMKIDFAELQRLSALVTNEELAAEDEGVPQIPVFKEPANVTARNKHARDKIEILNERSRTIQNEISKARRAAGSLAHFHPRLGYESVKEYNSRIAQYAKSKKYRNRAIYALESTVPFYIEGKLVRSRFYHKSRKWNFVLADFKSFSPSILQAGLKTRKITVPASDSAMQIETVDAVEGNTILKFFGNKMYSESVRFSLSRILQASDEQTYLKALNSWGAAPQYFQDFISLLFKKIAYKEAIAELKAAKWHKALTEALNK